MRTSFLRSLLPGCVVVLFLAGPTPAAGALAFRKAITINQPGGRATLTDFPFLVSISGDADLTANVQSASGHDIAFKDTDGVTQLDFEIDYFDRTAGDLAAWVKIPSLPSGVATTIYMDYGDAQITASPSNACAVWDADYVGVWHLGESGSGTADEFRDSSMYGNHGRGGEGDPLFVPSRVTGAIGFGQRFSNADGKWDLIDAGDDPSLNVTGTQITLEAWVVHNVTAPSSGAKGIMSRKGFSDGYRIALPDWGSAPPPTDFNLPGSTDLLRGDAMSAGAWHHVTATYDGSLMRFYLDGIETDQRAKTTNILSATAEQEFWIGHGDQAKDRPWSFPWDGDIDEVRVSRVARSADWIATQYDNHTNTCLPTTAFCSLGAETPGSYAVDFLETHYRSIGTSAGALESAGTATATAGSTTITFSGVILPANVGQGDRLTLDPGGSPETLFILSRDGDDQVTVQSPAGTSRTVGYTITRAYNSLAAWEEDISLGGRGGALVAENRREVGVAYNDGPFTAGVVFDGSTTDCARSLRLTVAPDERHTGIAGTGAVLDNGGNATPAIQIADEFVTVEWLEIKGGSGAAADGIELAGGIGPGNRIVMQYNVVHDTGGDGIQVSAPDVTAHLYNNVVYNATNGIRFTVDLTASGHASVFNNTIYGSSGSGVATDVRPSMLRLDLRNNIAHSNAGGDLDVAQPFDRAYFCDGDTPTCTQIANGGTVPDPNEYLVDQSANFTLALDSASDYLYLGSPWMFRGVEVRLATTGAGSSLNLSWEYWNGSTWANLETNGFNESTNHLRSNGLVQWPNDPVDWDTTSVEGSPNLYYIRCSLPVGSYTTFPIESMILRADVTKGSRANLTGDLSAVRHSRFSGLDTGVPSVPLGSVGFVETTPGAEDLHIASGSAAQDVASDLSLFFTGDIDGALRTAAWDIGADDVNATTAVRLARFEAQGRDGAVELVWETASEIDNLGFHVHRAEAEAGPFRRITARLLPGLGSSPAGARYTYLDEGLANGSLYYYRLEDVETSGARALHGPVSARPAPDIAARRPRGRDMGSPTTLITYGDPSRNAFRILERGPGGMVLELITEGFYAEPQGDGTVRLEVPGLEPFANEGFPELPARRSWIEAEAGRRVDLVSSEEEGIASFPLVPAGAGSTEVIAGRHGALRVARASRSGSGRTGGATAARYPAEAARIASVGYQRDAKKALVELFPMRWRQSELQLIRRLRVRLSFLGADRGDAARGGERGRGRGGEEKAKTATPASFRFATTERGLHAIAFEDVFGRRGGGIATRDLRVSRQGEAVPFHVEPDPERFRPGSLLYFLSEGAASNPYGNEAVYELSFGGSGIRMAVAAVAATGAPVDRYRHRVEREENRLYQAGLLQARDAWLWDSLFAPATKSYSFPVSNLVVGTEPASLTVWLQGGSESLEGTDHHVRVYVNGVFSAETIWAGKTPRTIQATILPGVLHEGENLLALENVGDAGALYSMVLLDRFEVTYPRRPVAIGGRLEGVFGASGRVEAEGFEGGGLILDVTETVSRWMGRADAAPEGRIGFRAEADRRYLVLGAGSVLRPEARPVSATGLGDPSHRADYLVIGPEALLAETGPLLALRERQGLAVRAVALESVASAFGFGESSPRALRDFLAHAYHDWAPPAPRYVVLLGDATYDFKDYLGTGVRNRVPPLLVRTSYLWTASDPSYAAVHGEDILPDLAIGRLPAANALEARRMVEKIVAYEAGAASLGAPVVLVADDSDRAGDFEADADALAATLLASRAPQKIYLGRLGIAAARSSTRSAFDEGAALVSYLGHGGIHLWAEEGVFQNGDVAGLAAQGQQPILLTMNCLNGYFHFPYFNSLAEELLKAEGKGVIAAFSPSGFSRNEPAHRLHEALLARILEGGHARLGDAVLAAQSDYAETGAFPELLIIYHLLGDPALTLKH